MVNNTDEIKSLLKKAKAFYKKHFGLKRDFSSLYVPDPPDPRGNYWFLINDKDMTPNKALAACKKLFECNKFTYEKEEGVDLDIVLPQDVRKTDAGAYAIWIYAGQEPEERFATMSHHDLGFGAIRPHFPFLLHPTLTEQLLLELQYFEKTGNNMNKKATTRCDGSLTPNGYVPCVSGYDDDNTGINITCCRPDQRDAILLSRSVVG